MEGGSVDEFRGGLRCKIGVKHTERNRAQEIQEMHDLAHKNECSTIVGHTSLLRRTAWHLNPGARTTQLHPPWADPAAHSPALCRPPVQQHTPMAHNAHRCSTATHATQAAHVIRVSSPRTSNVPRRGVAADQLPQPHTEMHTRTCHLVAAAAAAAGDQLLPPHTDP